MHDGWQWLSWKPDVQPPAGWDAEKNCDVTSACLAIKTSLRRSGKTALHPASKNQVLSLFSGDGSDRMFLILCPL
jgi:hypothetical protein